MPFIVVFTVSSAVQSIPKAVRATRPIIALIAAQTKTNARLLHCSINKPVVDRRLRPRCCHPGSYFKHASFSCLCIRTDIMCKHCLNIQHAHCGPVGCDCMWRLQTCASAACNGYSYIRAMPKPACESHCLSQAATSSSLSLCANMTSPTKPEIRNISLHHRSRTEPRPYATAQKIFWRSDV